MRIFLSNILCSTVYIYIYKNQNLLNNILCHKSLSQNIYSKFNAGLSTYSLKTLFAIKLCPLTRRNIFVCAAIKLNPSFMLIPSIKTLIRDIYFRSVKKQLEHFKQLPLKQQRCLEFLKHFTNLNNRDINLNLTSIQVFKEKVRLCRGIFNVYFLEMC